MDKLQVILRGIASHTQQLGAASEQLLDATQEITTNSGETAARVKSVSRVTLQVTQNLQSRCLGAGEMTSTVQSIAANVQ